MSKRSWTDEELITAVSQSKNLSEVSGTKEQTLAKARRSKSEITNDIVFSANSPMDRGAVKHRIIRDKLLPYECALCHMIDWMGQPLSLHLDHTNGINNDNRLENLRFLCPNCHSLTDTYCGKQLRKEKPLPPLCPTCQGPMYQTSKQCQGCANKNSRPTKIDWPSNQTLLNMIKTNGTISAVARKLGVSFNALKRRLHK